MADLSKASFYSLNLLFFCLVNVSHGTALIGMEKMSGFCQ